MMPAFALPAASLKQEQQLMLEKLSFLRLKRAVETDAEVQFKLDEGIFAAEQRWRDLAEQLRRAETGSSSEQLFQALLNLNYKAQIRRFRQLVTNHPSYACLIHGEPAHGQHWLLNRLIELIPGSGNGRVLSVDLGRRGRTSSVIALWRELGQQVGLSGAVGPENIAVCVQQWLQTQTVVIVLDQIDLMPHEQVTNLLEQFWKPLVQNAGSSVPQQHRLVLLCIAYSGPAEAWSVPMVDLPGPGWQGHELVRLPVIACFDQEMLATWVADQVLALPVTAIEAAEATAQNLFDAAEAGTPEYVFDEICTLCKLRWSDYEALWVKY